MVHYYPHANGLRLIARVEAQRSDGKVDLLVFNPDWFPSLADRLAVPVVEDDGKRPEEGDFCVWRTQPRPRHLFESVEDFPLTS